MLNFKTFLKEELINEELLLEAESSSVDSDDKGKLHELLLAKYLHPQEKLPEHHRSFSDNADHAGTPEQVHSKLKDKIPSAAYDEIDRHAKQSAAAFKESLKAQGHIGDHAHIGNVHWTSNADKEGKPGDHFKTVKDANGNGVSDPNSNADLIVTLHDKEGKPVGYHGISAKYGSQEPNYRNPGLDSLEKTAKLPSGSLRVAHDIHTANMEKLHYTGSADQRNIMTKIDEMSMEDSVATSGKSKGKIIPGIRSEYARLSAQHANKALSGKTKTMHEHLGKFLQAHDSLPKKEQAAFLQSASQRAALARQSNNEKNTQIMQQFTAGIAKHTPEELENIIRQNVSPNTHIPHTVVHSKVKEDGSAQSVIKPMHSLADEHLSQFEPGSLKVYPGKGTAVAIKGIHIKTGKPVVAARYTVKSSSGAHKSPVGTFKLQ
jgi:hypothetical protein